MHIWVAHLVVSRSTASKISSKHGVHEDEIRRAVQCVANLPTSFDDDPIRGKRVLVKVRIRGLSFLIVLYPDRRGLEDTWHLGSAYRYP